MSGLRLRLTLLYAVPFFVVAAVLVAFASLDSSDSSPAGSQPVPPEEHTDRDPRILLFAAVALLILAGLAFVLGWLVAGRFLKPLRTITATARDISASNLHRRLGRSGRRDEFAELAATLDGLFARLEAAFEAQRQFVANASHELRTPLTAQRALLQVALSDPDASVDSLRSAGREVLMLGQSQERLIAALLALATGDQGVRRSEPFDLARLAASVVEDRRGEAERRGIAVHPALASAPATGDPSLVHSLVANLVDNALRHNTAGGWVEVVTAADAGPARLSVRNTGPVVPADRVEHLFRPFQRLDGQRLRPTDGHGLGLAIVRAIALAHGAELTAEPRTGGGLTITVAFGP